MSKTYDWLFGYDFQGKWKDHFERAERLLSADPKAAAISDEEGEQFAAVAWTLRQATPSLLATLCRTLRLPAIIVSKPKMRRRVTLQIVRRWKEPRWNEHLVRILGWVSMGEYLSAKEFPNFWTEETFVRAYFDGACPAWLAQVYRTLHPDADIGAWLQALDGERAERVFRFWVTLGKLAVRRIAYPDPVAATTTAADEAAPAALEDLSAKVARKSRLSEALRHDVRRLEQDRKRLRAEARRRFREREAMLSQARGEIKAARRALAEQRAAWEKELQAERRRFETEMARLQVQMATARTGFLQDLVPLTSTLLQGMAVSVTGGDAEINRAVVETLGATESPSAETLLSVEGGLADLERQLHALAFRQMQIRCDGSHRRKGKRPGIASAAFQAYVGGRPVIHQHRIVCCGAAAWSQMAEFGALTMALTWLLATVPGPGAHVEILSDCKYMVDHINGRRPAPEMQGCLVLNERAGQLLRRLERRGIKVTLRWVKRDIVHAEDRLCDIAYYEATWYHCRPAECPTLPLKSFLANLG